MIAGNRVMGHFLMNNRCKRLHSEFSIMITLVIANETVYNESRRFIGK